MPPTVTEIAWARAVSYAPAAPWPWKNHKAMIIPYKQLRFDETGQNPNATAMVVQIQEGRLRLVYPEHLAEPDAKLIWPYPQAK